MGKNKKGMVIKLFDVFKNYVRFKRKVKRIVMKRKILITTAAVATSIIGLVGCGGKADNKTADASSEAKTEAVTQTKVVTEATTPAPTTAAVSASKKHAIKIASDNLQYSRFSKKGLRDQLKFQGFSEDDAAYAVEHINVDWNQQAAKKAEHYIDSSPFSFSHSQLVRQLELEGFTNEQAEFGTTSVGL
ncbi:MAG: Ltp family lipoprotein [Clostridiales bacterium]|nr:Ltp family lipoprotein [Clostridiales bacterium]